MCYPWLVRLTCLSLVVLGVARCAPDGAGSIVYQVEVQGSAIAFRDFVVEASGFEGEPARYKGAWFAELLRMKQPLDCEYAEISVFRAVRSGAVQGSTSLRPFVCRGHPDCAARLAGGWQAVEEHSLFLEDDGTLLKNNDFEHALSYGCSWRSPNGKDGDGGGTIQSTLGECTESDRSATDVKLYESARGQLWPRGGSRLCNSFLVGRATGVLVVHIEFADSSFLQLGFCLPETGLQLPLSVSAQELASSKCPWQGASLGNRIAKDGHWRIIEADLGRDGWQRGYISMLFGDSSGDSDFLVEGTISLPIVQF